jgi:aminoglycoside/choline kinase family phosphotransferase
MSQQPGIADNVAFAVSAEDRLSKYCEERFAGSLNISYTKLMGDASTRQYFRVRNNKASYIAAVYPEPFDPQHHPYCDVTSLYATASVPVPEIIDTSGSEGIMLQEDLGDGRLQDWLATASQEQIESVYKQAVDIIIRIQAATKLAYEKDSVASRLAFDEGRLLWELKFFYQHFTNVSGKSLSPADEDAVMCDLTTIARELAGRPRLLTHRDYHSRNLMLGAGDALFVIDHQDARMGPFSYDLASLLYDPYAALSDELITELYDYYVAGFKKAVAGGNIWIARETSDRKRTSEFQQLSAEDFDPADFRPEFEMMTLQRMLKAVGTYTYQQGVFNNDVYVSYIDPAFLAARRALNSLDRFPALSRFIGS